MRQKSDVICYCMDITYEKILEAIQNGAKTVEEVIEATDAGITCGYCIEDLEDIIEELD